MKETTEKSLTAKKSWVLPGVKLTQEEFEAGIREAEESPSYTVEEARLHMKKWMTELRKK